MPSITITLKTDDGLHVSVRKQQTEDAVLCVYNALGVAESDRVTDLADLHALAMCVSTCSEGATLKIEYEF